VNIWGLDFSHAFGSFDLPPIVALALYLAIVVVLFSATVDVIVAWLDPRLRRAGPTASRP